ncbi:hypothetical protein LEP1GSC186_1688 [Leptospira noguchii serovar Autumnalis str. ZUN142]|uniref:Uncharacterized protein n=1 Tax=Leptospira noguchii serovar Autumnalis str. ZUN142 TaxID=1085540 RepID=M6U4H2_9LEPT|nr:hypothetical protein LEP1GSC186_1688 [Leptospira noguchii serovar Autumnalis str. ZUN142]
MAFGKVLYYFIAPVGWYSVFTRDQESILKKGSSKFWNKL